jgi:hypothetical protein
MVRPIQLAWADHTNLTRHFKKLLKSDNISVLHAKIKRSA